MTNINDLYEANYVYVRELLSGSCEDWVINILARNFTNREIIIERCRELLSTLEIRGQLDLMANKISVELRDALDAQYENNE